MLVSYELYARKNLLFSSARSHFLHQIGKEVPIVWVPAQAQHTPCLVADMSICVNPFHLSGEVTH
jgi:hypothetical protein